MVYIIMGVTGSGKTTIGQLLARRFNLPFYDADDFHELTNKSKMQTGQPLTDHDRENWLTVLGRNIIDWEDKGGAVLACSALKELYRKKLQTISAEKITWIFLNGTPELISERLKNRQNHFMHPSLISSQYEVLEKPDYAYLFNVDAAPEVIVENIISNMKNKGATYEFGLIGMGVMGKSLALNLAEKGVRVAIYNRHVPGKEEGVAQKIKDENPQIQNLGAFDDLAQFIGKLEKPRKVFLMIMAGAATDSQLEQLVPLLEPGDVVMDGGNSFFKDTERRTKELAAHGIYFVGTGVSGGEEGARRGPAIMPGGAEKGYALVAKYFGLIAAKDKNGKPCTAYIGAGGAGHFVKMVHNGIEYAEMQLLAETYALMRFYLQLTPEEIVEVLTPWQQSELGSYLLGITINILKVKEKGGLLLDKVLDQAEQKGTGNWSITTALDFGAPFSLVSEAVMARILSAHKQKRVQLANFYDHQFIPHNGNKETFLTSLRNAYLAARIINHEMGFSMMQQVAAKHGWQINWSELARIWTNGCIIRSALMEKLTELLKEGDSVFLAPEIKHQLQQYKPDLSFIIAQGLQNNVALPVFSAALNYFLGSATANSPANLIQAQRDYFGAHTYRRTDAPDSYFHSDWKPDERPD